MNEFSRRFRFADWPNQEVPLVSAGVYAVWEGEQLIYCGMARAKLESAIELGRKKRGLRQRLTSHASGRLSGDQFCVYIASRLVVPELPAQTLPRLRAGTETLDALTKKYIHDKLDYQFACVQSSAEALELEQNCRQGRVFGVQPLLNPLNNAV
jgi:hypothetical protein